MKRFAFLAGALTAAVALTVPTLGLAQPPQPQEDRGIYDRDHKDYHKWDDREDRAWRRWLKETHREDHEFAKAKRREQSEYWKWRHEHPDRD